MSDGEQVFRHVCSRPDLTVSVRSQPDAHLRALAAHLLKLETGEDGVPALVLGTAIGEMARRFMKNQPPAPTA